MRSQSVVAISIAAAFALCGCGTRPAAKLNNSEPTVLWEHPQGLPALARVVTDEQPVTLTGFTFTPSEKDEFDRRRADEVSARASGYDSGSGGMGNALGPIVAQPWLLPVMIVALPVAAITVSVVNHSRASKRTPDRISNKKGTHLAKGVAEGASNSPIGTRISTLVETAGLGDGDAEYPYLAVSVKSASLEHYSSEDRITLVAVAQAHLAPGVEWEPTSHYHVFAVRKGQLEQRTVDTALEALAKSIVVTYMPEHPIAVSKRSETGDWEALRHSKSPAELQAFLERYPDGKFAEQARKRLVRAKRGAKWDALFQNAKASQPWE